MTLHVYSLRPLVEGEKKFDKIKFDTNCICSQGEDIETFSQEKADSDFICLSR